MEVSSLLHDPATFSGKEPSTYSKIRLYGFKKRKITYRYWDLNLGLSSPFLFIIPYRYSIKIKTMHIQIRKQRDKMYKSTWPIRTNSVYDENVM